MKRNHIDINCDLGEVSCIEDCAHDTALMPYISSCNIACGGHAGTPEVIAETIRNAQLNGLKIGAHPGYEDKLNFGRVQLKLANSKLKNSLKKQIELLISGLNSQHLTLHHIKLHGALYNQAESNSELAQMLADFFLTEFPQQKILCLLGGEFYKACKQKNVAVIAEGFMDRAYLDNGRLMPRNQPGAIFNSAKKCSEQALQLITHAEIDSICLHGDNTIALEIAKHVHAELKANGIIIQ
jgi:UPF0271 protein